MNDTPDTAFAVPFEDGADVLSIDEVVLVRVDLCRVLVLLGRICGQGITRNLVQTLVDLGMRVVEVINRDDLEAASLLENVDDVRACPQRNTVNDIL